MSGNNKNKKYESTKIPYRQLELWGRDSDASPKGTAGPVYSGSNDMYYEIEYDDSYPIPGVGKFVLKPQRIKEPEKDEIRELFSQMRDMARAYSFTYDFSKYFDRRVQQANAVIFYKQGMFMQDFSDNYSKSEQLSKYFPNYQMMGYSQLRTFFTWRTEVRQGNVTDTSLSYAFLYIYELLGNIGVKDPQDGLDKLMFFWKAYREYNKSIDKYVLRWLKDYHIYYQLPHSFPEFIKINNLTQYYPGIEETKEYFDLFCAISKYDIRKSIFFTEDNIKLSTDCFYFVMGKLRQIFLENSIDFEQTIFHSTKKMAVWTPFKDAIFYPWVKQKDRRIVLSEKEIYVCSQNKWAFCTTSTIEGGKQFLGYVMKQMEAALRRAVNYKFRFSVQRDAVTHPVADKLKKAGLSLESIINDAVLEFYREETKTVIKVDLDTLSIIRQEALNTQEKLIVPEQDDFPCGEAVGKQASPASMAFNLPFAAPQDMPALEKKPDSMYDEWEGLKKILTETEKKALSVLLHREIEIKKFADECGIMLEVLIDGINEKAMDSIGDNLMNEEFVLYEDYKEQVKEMVG